MVVFSVTFVSLFGPQFRPPASVYLFIWIFFLFFSRLAFSALWSFFLAHRGRFRSTNVKKRTPCTREHRFNPPAECVRAQKGPKSDPLNVQKPGGKDTRNHGISCNASFCGKNHQKYTSEVSEWCSRVHAVHFVTLTGPKLTQNAPRRLQKGPP